MSKIWPLSTELIMLTKKKNYSCPAYGQLNINLVIKKTTQLIQTLLFKFGNRK